MADRRRRRQTSHSESEYSENEDIDKDSERGVTSDGEKIESDEEDDYTYTEDETCTEYGEGDSIIIEDEWVDGERQSGDGAEEQPDKSKEKLDDDQDRKNPAYVPRRGAFYEHDFRDGEGDAKPKDDEREKKKLWQDTGKWMHDKYSDQEQAPKSSEELIAMYGYDIRASDKPPEMTRRKQRSNPMDRKSQLMDFLDRPQGNGDYRRGGRGGGGRGRGGRGRGRGYPPQDNSRRAYGNFRDQQGVNNQYRGNRQSPQQNHGPARYHEQSPPQDPTPSQQYRPDRRTPAQAPPSPQGPPPQHHQQQQGAAHGGDQAPTAPQQQDRVPQQQQQQQTHPTAPPQPQSQGPQRGGMRGGRNKSITPDRIPPKKNIEGVLECAPPLTVVETRTSYAVTQSGDARNSHRTNSGESMGPPPHQRQHQSHERMSVPSSFQNSSNIGPPPPRGFVPTGVRSEVRPTKRYSTQRQRSSGESGNQGQYPQPRMTQGHQHRMRQQQQPNRTPFFRPGPPPAYQQQQQQPPQAGSGGSGGPRASVVPQRPVYPGEAQSPPHGAPHGAYRQPPPRQQLVMPASAQPGPQPQQLVYTSMPITTQIQTPPRLVYPAAGPPTAPPPPQPLVPPPPQLPGGQQQYIAATPLVNFAPATGYQQLPALPVQFPPPNVTTGAVTLVSAGPSGPIPSAAALQASHPPVTGGPTGAFPPPPPEPGHGTPPAIQMRGGTTYFSPNIQPAHPGPSPARRPKAAIPIVNPQDVGAGEEYYEEEYQEYESGQYSEYPPDDLQYSQQQYTEELGTEAQEQYKEEPGIEEEEQYTEAQEQYTEHVADQAQNTDVQSTNAQEQYTTEQSTEVQEQKTDVQSTEAQSTDAQEQYTKEQSTEVQEQNTDVQSTEAQSTDAQEQYTKEQSTEGQEQISDAQSTETQEQNTDAQSTEVHEHCTEEKSTGAQEQCTEEQSTEGQEQNTDVQVQSTEIQEQHTDTKQDPESVPQASPEQEGTSEHLTEEGQKLETEEVLKETAVEPEQPSVQEVITNENAEMDRADDPNTSGEVEFSESVEHLPEENAKDTNSDNSVPALDNSEESKVDSQPDQAVCDDLQKLNLDKDVKPTEAEEEEFVECSEEQKEESEQTLDVNTTSTKGEETKDKTEDT